MTNYACSTILPTAAISKKTLYAVEGVTLAYSLRPGAVAGLLTCHKRIAGIYLVQQIFSSPE